MATDKNLNALVTFHVPEVFEDSLDGPQTR
jgi:hypothetical protein